MYRFHSSLLVAFCFVSLFLESVAFSPLGVGGAIRKQSQLWSAERPKVVIVGGGVGGLAIASRIAASVPSKVTILEKNDFIGGRCGSFDVHLAQGTFRHERGPSLLLLPHVYKEIFEKCGKRPLAEYGLEIKPCIPAYKVIFEDGDSIEVGFPRQSALDDQSLKMMELAESESRAKMDEIETDGSLKWDVYMRACEAFLECGLPNFIEQRLDLLSFPAFLVEALRDFGKAWPLKPHSDVLDKIFQSDKLKAVASFQDLYVGLEPFRNDKLLGGGVIESTAPAVFGLLSAIELHPTNPKCGVYAPVGGFQKVSESLQKLAEELGVEILPGKTVLSVDSAGVTYCATTAQDSSSPQFEAADLVVVNADLPYATKSLFNGVDDGQPTYDWDDKYRYSCGVIAFHWSIDKSLDDLNTHNVFMSAERREVSKSSWSVLREEDGVPPLLTHDQPFNFYVHRATKTDPSAAPLGMDSIMVLVPCGTLKRNRTCSNLSRDEALRVYQESFGKDIVTRARDAVLHRMGSIASLQDLRWNILHETVDTPVTLADQYNVAAGTPFALSHGLGQLSLTRPGFSSTKLPNVLFCGASTRPGNGVPLVLIGSKLVAERAALLLKQVISSERVSIIR